MQKENINQLTSSRRVSMRDISTTSIKCHSKLDLESHPILLRNDEILNQVQDDKKWDRDDEGRSKNVGQVLQIPHRMPQAGAWGVSPDNKRSSTFPLDGEGAPSTWRERAECVSTGVRGKSAFTLIELLVVVLIIGILAAVALPQYQSAVEKARMTEAVINVRAIANAHQLYYLAHSEYLGPSDIEKLDIRIPGGVLFGNRIATKDFYYSPNGSVSADVWSDYLSLAWLFKIENNHLVDIYKVYITQEEPNKIKCGSAAAASAIQQKLCAELNSKGTL